MQAQKRAIREVTAFIEALQTTLRPTPPIGGRTQPDALVMFSREGRSITLVGESARKYQFIVGGLFDSLPGSRKAFIDRKTVERWVQVAIIRVLGSPASDRPSRLKTAIQVLSQELAQAPTGWRVYFPVSGVSVGTRSRRFGGARFQDRTPPAVGALRSRGARIIRQIRNAPEDKRAFLSHFSEVIDSALTDRSLAEVDVIAVDSESAQHLARRRLRDTLDGLTFCDSLVTSPGVWAVPSIDGDERPLPPVAVFNGSDSVAISGPDRTRFPVMLTRLFSARRVALTRRISRLLNAATLTDDERRIREAICWAGRASGRARPAEAFLFFLIALETLMLGANEGALTYKLRVRCAHLLAKPAIESRRQVSDRIASLYGIRSAIVHKGVRDVSADDLGSARLYAHRGILTAIYRRRARKQSFEDWLEEQVLR